jgi:hypothetical protein
MPARSAELATGGGETQGVERLKNGEKNSCFPADFH